MNPDEDPENDLPENGYETDCAGTYTGTPELTARKLRELLHYEPSTGVFTRKVKTAQRIRVGDVAGSKRADGYLAIRVLGRSYRSHRLAWVYVYGDWPVSHIDHINGDRADNRINNLRDVPRSINMQNQRRAFRNSAHGFLGVTRSGKRWMAKIGFDGRWLYLGTHNSPELAHAAYLDAKRLMHPGCSI